MEEEFDNKLVVRASNGEDVTISVLDIIDSIEFNKSFVIYSMGSEDVYASVLNETDTTFSLDAITDQSEWDYINAMINKTVSEMGM